MIIWSKTTSITINTHKSSPPSITSCVTLSSHVITGSPVSTMSYTLSTTVETVPSILTFYWKKQTVHLCSSNIKIKGIQCVRITLCILKRSNMLNHCSSFKDVNIKNTPLEEFCKCSLCPNYLHIELYIEFYSACVYLLFQKDI